MDGDNDATYGDGAYRCVFAEPEQADFDGSPGTWNIGPSACGLSDSACINPELLYSAGAGIDVSSQRVPDQSDAGFSSAGGSQARTTAP